MMFVMIKSNRGSGPLNYITILIDIEYSHLLYGVKQYGGARP